MVRRFVLCEIVCMSVALSLSAQAPMQDWRPNIADDNKAASYKDTQQFLNGFITKSGDFSFSDVVLKTAVDLDDESASNPSCRLSVRQTYWHAVPFGDDRPGLIFQFGGIINLKNIDPLSIRVDVAPDDPRWPKMLEVYFEAKDKGDVGTSMLLGANKIKRPADTELLSGINCDSPSLHESDGKRKKTSYCRVDPHPWPYSYRLFINGQESAHRIAQALMQASLLCGGTKAVSPF